MQLRFAPLRSGTLLSLVLVFLGSGFTLAARQCDYEIDYGMNPSFQTWSSRGIVFSDAMARVKEFLRVEADGSFGPAELVALDDSSRPGAGWPDPATLGPGQEFAALIFGSMEGTLPDGRVQPYIVTWQGKGTCSLVGPSVVSEAHRTPGRVEVFVDPGVAPNSNLSCRWSTSDPSDPVRDVHVWLPGMEGGARLFWPPYLEKVKAMNGGRGPVSWRALDWTRVNDYGRPLDEDGFVFDLAGRVRPDSPSQGTRRGMAVEYIVAFCNEVGADLHFQVPHRTADMTPTQYIAFLADALLRIRDGSPGIPGIQDGKPFEGLDPAHTVTLELSNEIWNPGFPVNRWMASEAARRGITTSEQIAGQIELVFRVAREAFAGPEAKRLKTYIGGWLRQPAYLAGVLAALRPDTQIDSLGPAVYFKPRRSDPQLWGTGATPGSCPNCPTLTEFLDSVEAGIEETRPFLRQHRALAESWINPDGTHPALVLYEAGPNLGTSLQRWSAVAQEAQTAPRLHTLLERRLVPLLIEEGVRRVNWYSFMTSQTLGTFGVFGFWNDMDQQIELPVVDDYLHEGAPKATFLCQGPPLSKDCPLARTIHRNVGSNPDSYTVTRPILGRSFFAAVDLRTTGHPFAGLFGFENQVEVPLTGGTFLLSGGPGPSEVLSLRPGPLAVFRVAIPNDVAMAGLMVSTQAVHVGPNLPPAFSNAQDLVFGRE